jgi:hypothetical protein
LVCSGVEVSSASCLSALAGRSFIRPREAGKIKLATHLRRQMPVEEKQARRIAANTKLPQLLARSEPESP